MRIYLYNSDNQKVEVIELVMPRAKIFNLSDNIYVQKGDGGLYSIQNGKAVLESDDPLFYNNFISLNIMFSQKYFYFQSNFFLAKTPEIQESRAGYREGSAARCRG